LDANRNADSVVAAFVGQTLRLGGAQRTADGVLTHKSVRTGFVVRTRSGFTDAGHVG